MLKSIFSKSNILTPFDEINSSAFLVVYPNSTCPVVIGSLEIVRDSSVFIVCVLPRSRIGLYQLATTLLSVIKVASGV